MDYMELKIWENLNEYWQKRASEIWAEDGHELTKQEELQWLVDSGQFPNEDIACGFISQKKLINSDKTISISDLVYEFIERDMVFGGKSWDLCSILSVINMVIPIEDRTEV